MEETTLFEAPKSHRAKSGFAGLGRLLIAAGIVLALVLLSPYIILEAGWRLGLLGNKEATVVEEIEGESPFGRVIRESDIKILKPVSTNFSLIIPRIGVNAEVIANVPLSNQSEDTEALKKGVAHAAGSFLPGQNGTVMIFGHSTDYIWNISRYNALLYFLKELKVEDQINVFYQGKRYVYQVTDKQFVSGEDENLLARTPGEKKLALVTCWPPGTTLERLAVFAKEI
jgi:LPXTG-site transpeptidase (sortase) family protein